MNHWSDYATFGAILVTSTLAMLRLLHAIAGARREARWNRGLPPR